MKNRPAKPKWIQTQYDIIEQQNKYQKHKLTKREFMKGMMNEKREETEKTDDQGGAECLKP